MKTDFNTTVEGRGPRVGGQNSRPSGRLSTLDSRLSTAHSGVALVITLILLSVVTFMAITFLALSRRERGAVTTATDAAGARLAADAALASAEAQIIANALSATNPFSFGLLVSTNYINYAGFDQNVTGFDATNVNYDHLLNSGVALDQSQFLQNQLNLFYSPRPPVFVPTTAAGYDFRYYLDLNRNGQFDTNGWVTNVYNSGGGLGTTSFQVGDPEWIGVLEKPDQPHGPNNKFIARYAFIAVPVGNTLDLNAIHNQVLQEQNLPLNLANDGYFRNQGVGSWEINLAAFLADLNTNEWDSNTNGGIYQYNRPGSYANSDAAFNDAFSILTNRYAGNYYSLANASSCFAKPAGYPFNIDGYSDGPLQVTMNTNASFFSDTTNWPWAGADNTNHFFTHQELFNTNGISTDFVNRLLQAGANVSTYDRYTFYRLLSQLGTDTAPEQGKMNVNYDNLSPYSVRVGMSYVTNPPSSTNFLSWTPLGFFTNAADRLLRAYTAQWRAANPTNFATTFYAVSDFNFDQSRWSTNYLPFGITNIPVLVSNQFVYTPAVNRLLQLAANIFDATTNNTYAKGKNYPSVFRPTFWVANEFGYTNVYINGYEYIETVSGTNDGRLAQPVDVTTLPPGLGAVNYPYPSYGPNGGVNVYNVPWIIGAKKGFPNFNEFVMENIVDFTRRLQVTRYTNSTTDVKLTGTNQMYLMSINTALGVDLWNSYTNQYGGNVSGIVRENLSLMLTNDDSGFSWAPLAPMTFSINCPFSISPWPAQTMVVPLAGMYGMLTNSVYRSPYAASSINPSGFNSPCLIPTNYFSGAIQWETNTIGFPFPRWGLLATNQLQVFMLDLTNGYYHVIDYVHFQKTSSRNLNSELFTDDDDGVWPTNVDTATGFTYGIQNQIKISKGTNNAELGFSSDPPGEDGLWKADPEATTLGTTKAAQQASFDAFFWAYGTVIDYVDYGVTRHASNMLSLAQAPYTPTRRAVSYTVLQANDPLVHYQLSDLNPSYKLGLTNHYDYPSSLPGLTNLDLGLINRNYQPWGGSPRFASSSVFNFNLSIKDPLVWRSDDWDFPTNKLPGVGWLGRVHRGTPWQTVYMKASATGLTNWMTWTGNYNSFDANDSSPVQDRLLFDLFTTAFNDNATRGTLSINVEAGNSALVAGLGAWSALFSGVVSLSNNVPDSSITNLSVPVQHQTTPPGNSYWIIQPAGPNGINSPLGWLVAGINKARTNVILYPTNVSPLRIFTHTGDENELVVSHDGTNAFSFIRFPGQTFRHVGDILAVPQLTQESPFLHLSNYVNNAWVEDLAQKTNGISDEMYEWLPQQTMSLLRCSSSPRYVIYCYGQTLKPAPNGIYMGSDHFGLVTNYQVVSETATRAVVRFGSTLTNIPAPLAYWTNGVYVTNWYSLPVLTNNNAVIEQFNLLPPD